MTLSRDGQAHVNSLATQRRTPQAFVARVAPWAIEGITKGLSESGFPPQGLRPLPVGIRVNLLSLTTRHHMVQLWLSREHRRELPSLDRALRMLEAIAYAASHGSLGEPCALDGPILV